MSFFFAVAHNESLRKNHLFSRFALFFILYHFKYSSFQNLSGAICFPCLYFSKTYIALK